MNLDIHHYQDHTVTVIVPQGDIDASNAPDFGAYLRTVIQQADPILIVLDMENVRYMSSAGLREIVAALKQTLALDGTLCLASLQDRLKPVFEMVGLDSLSTFYRSVYEAVRQLQTK